MGPFSSEEAERLLKLIVIGLFGMVAWLANHLFHGRKLPVGRFIGGLVGALIASMSVVGIVKATVQNPSIELLFGVSGVVGWVGGNSLARIFDHLEQYIYRVLLGEDKDGRATKR